MRVNPSTGQFPAPSQFSTSSHSPPVVAARQTTVFGSFTLIVQSRELIAPFRWLRLKASPVLTLGFLLPFLINVIV